MDSWQSYRITITPFATKGLTKLGKKHGKALLEQVRDAITDLRYDPESKTQGLSTPLAQYRSLHVSRVRVIVKIDDLTVTVHVVAAGWHTSGDRDDVYKQLQRLIEREGDQP